MRASKTAIARSVGSSVGLLLLTALVSASALGQRRPVDEMTLKSGVLFKIISYSTWPKTAFADHDDVKAPFIVGVQSDPELAKALASLRAKHVRGRKLVVRKLEPGQPVNGCHAVYSNLRSKSDLAALVNTTKGTSTLLISDAGPVDALAQGIGVNFIRKKQRRGQKLVVKLRFEINTKAIKQRHLRIDSRVLRLATRVVK